MKVIEPGHIYKLLTLDGHKFMDGDITQFHQFVIKYGPNYPGNEREYAGTTSQSVIRCLIDRARYVDNQDPHPANQVIIQLGLTMLWVLEERAADRHGFHFPFSPGHMMD